MCSQSSSYVYVTTTERKALGGISTLLILLVTLALCSVQVNARTLNDTERYRVLIEQEQSVETAQQALIELRKLPAPVRASARDPLFIDRKSVV